MSTVRPSTDNVERVHEQIIDHAAGVLAALKAGWYDLSRADRAEAQRCTVDLIANLRTLGVKA